MRQYVLNVARAASQLLNAIAGGDSDETVCARLYRLDRAGHARAHTLRPAVDWIALHIFHQVDHCWRAYQSERERSEYPPELRPNTPRGLPPPSP